MFISTIPSGKLKHIYNSVIKIAVTMPKPLKNHLIDAKK
jgi:hypothetical protein